MRSQLNLFMLAVTDRENHHLYFETNLLIHLIIFQLYFKGLLLY